ncbi:type II secretion system F family protein [Egicoccus sp. AB-alg6-2]|uniref:type II secretion system F family protein n=1 Tax=Egicoccus sp. AB-alg6-2 TaxID=3242692 RepID=UPI00359E349E
MTAAPSLRRLWPRQRQASSASAAALDVLRLRAAAGLPPRTTHHLSPRARRGLAVAEAVGAPLLPALDAAAAAEEDARAARRAVAVASAQTKAVAAGLLVAPFVLVPLLGGVFGADLAGFYATRPGRFVGAIGLALLGLGGAAVVALLRRIGAPPRPPAGPAVHRARSACFGLLAAAVTHPLVGVVVAVVVLVRGGSGGTTAPPGVDEAADLTATALMGGVGPGEALRMCADQLPAHAVELRSLALELELGLAARPGGPLARLDAVLRAAADVGAPAAPALRRLAGELRADERARVLAAAERLPAQLTFPTALALLPATLLLVGAPIVQVGLRQALP